MAAEVKQDGQRQTEWAGGVGTPSSEPRFIPRAVVAGTGQRARSGGGQEGFCSQDVHLNLPEAFFRGARPVLCHIPAGLTGKMKAGGSGSRAHRRDARASADAPATRPRGQSHPPWHCPVPYSHRCEAVLALPLQIGI